MINDVIDDLPALVGQVKKEGVTITDDIGIPEFGKFVHLMDNEGNKFDTFTILQ